MKKYLHIFLLVSWLTAIFIGCAPKIAAPPVVMPTAPPEEILVKLSNRFPKDEVLRTKARFAVKAKKGKLSTGVVLLAKRPAYLRIEALSLMGLPELILASNEKSLKIFAVRDEKFYIASADQDLSRFFPIYLNAQEAVALMLGMPPAGKETGSTVKSRMEDGLYRIDVLSGVERKQTLWLDPALLVVKRVEKLEAGRAIYTARYDDYRKVGEAYLPGRIDVHFNQPETADLTLRFSESEIEKSAGEDDFNIEPPEGIKPIYLE